jgi:peptidoglycan/LPS O-acetylase OafA/YrhL
MSAMTQHSSTADKESRTPDGRMPVLDGVRGVAILMVMMFHFWLFGTVPGATLWERVYSRVAGTGWIGVDLFFVLSGFLITGILYDSRGGRHYYRVFYARRTVRIFPLYYASLALFFWVIPFVLTRLHHGEFSDTHSSVLESVRLDLPVELV